MKIMWVSTSGDDANGGSYELPYKTIEKALTMFTNGDQIRLVGGTYTPVDSIVISGLDGSIFADDPGAVYIQPEKVTKHAACIAILDASRFLLAGVNVIQAADTAGNIIGIHAENIENFICLTCSVSDFDVPSGNGKGIFASGNGRVEHCRVSNFNCAGNFTYGIHTKGVDVIDCIVDEVSGVHTVHGILEDGLKDIS